MVKNFYDALQSERLQRELDPELIDVMHKLFRLYGLHTLEKEATEFYSSAAVTVRQIRLARTETVMKLLEEVRPHALRLVNLWQFSDWQLDSALGRKGGRVYEDLFHRVSEPNPLNGLTIDPYPHNDETASFRSKL